jgi:hypothetical protein
MRAFGPAVGEELVVEPSNTKTHSLRGGIGLLTGLVIVAAAIDLCLGGLLFTGRHGRAASAQLAPLTTVQTAARTATVGAIPSSAWQAGGVDLSQVPDFVPALSHGRLVGYIPKEQLFPPKRPAPQPRARSAPPSYVAPTAADMAAQNAALIKTVYASDLVTVVGHMFPGVGFVPVGGTPGPSTVTTVTGYGPGLGVVLSQPGLTLTR